MPSEVSRCPQVLRLWDPGHCLSFSLDPLPFILPSLALLTHQPVAQHSHWLLLLDGTACVPVLSLWLIPCCFLPLPTPAETRADHSLYSSFHSLSFPVESPVCLSINAKRLANGPLIVLTNWSVLLCQNILDLSSDLYPWVVVWAYGWHWVHMGCCLCGCCVQLPSWCCLRIIVPDMVLYCINNCRLEKNYRSPKALFPLLCCLFLKGIMTDFFMRLT